MQIGEAERNRSLFVRFICDVASVNLSKVLEELWVNCSQELKILLVAILTPNAVGFVVNRKDAVVNVQDCSKNLTAFSVNRRKLLIDHIIIARRSMPKPKAQPV